MTRVSLLAVGLVVLSVSSAGAAPPPWEMPAPPLRHAAQPDTSQPTPSPPADVDQEEVQTFEEEGLESEDESGDEQAEGTPRDVDTFADATLDARRLRFALNAFGDASFIGAMTDGVDGSDESATFQLGTFALLINGQLGQSLIGTAEVAFDANADNRQDIELERLHLRWQSERFFVVGGRMHTDLGYWNTAFHHGAWLHLPIKRPRVLSGEGSGGILPIHWIGVEGGVMLPVAPGTLTVAGGVGNGRGFNETDLRLNNDSNDFKAVHLKVEYLGLGLPDLRVGVGGLFDRIEDDAMNRPVLPGEDIDEIIANAYAAYRGVQLTLITEAYSIFHRADGETFTTIDAFVVAGYRFGRLTPYVLLERTQTSDDPDPFYSPVEGEMTRSTPLDQSEGRAGVRVDVSVWSAFKAEYGAILRDEDTDARGKGPDHTVMLNWSFGI
jgi:hypothetical protein